MFSITDSDRYAADDGFTDIIFEYVDDFLYNLNRGNYWNYTFAGRKRIGDFRGYDHDAENPFQLYSKSGSSVVYGTSIYFGINQGVTTLSRFASVKAMGKLEYGFLLNEGGPFTDSDTSVYYYKCGEVDDYETLGGLSIDTSVLSIGEWYVVPILVPVTSYDNGSLTSSKGSMEFSRLACWASEPIGFSVTKKSPSPTTNPLNNLIVDSYSASWEVEGEGGTAAYKSFSVKLRFDFTNVGASSDIAVSPCVVRYTQTLEQLYSGSFDLLDGETFYTLTITADSVEASEGIEDENEIELTIAITAVFDDATYYRNMSITVTKS